MEIPYKSLIPINKKHSLPLYVQIANGIIQQIQAGVIKKGSLLTGTRQLALLLEVNRQTVVAAFDELYAQGWIEVVPQKGTYVSNTLPNIQPKALKTAKINTNNEVVAPHDFLQNYPIQIPINIEQRLAFNDGLPDVRLAPRDALARLYAHYIRYGEPSILQYSNILGHIRFRETLSFLLNQTRGLSINPNQLISTRGSQMGIYLVASALIRLGDKVVIGQMSYLATNITFEHFGAELLTIPVDEDGMVIDALEEICTTQTIKAVYVTSHHYHPTTVTLKPERRIQLLNLAEKYGFFVIEDDYDYDYHYSNKPILPLASADSSGWVIYIGSFTKKIAPTFRVGYVIASEKIINELGKIRRIIDRQGDTILECCLADMLEDGTLKRHSAKALKEYHQRRDFACKTLKDVLGNNIQFKVPDGGMAIWAKFADNISLPKVAEKALQKGLYFPNGIVYRPVNACRLGFASMNLKELNEAIHLLGEII